MAVAGDLWCGSSWVAGLAVAGVQDLWCGSSGGAGVQDVWCASVSKSSKLMCEQIKRTGVMCEQIKQIGVMCAPQLVKGEV